MRPLSCPICNKPVATPLEQQASPFPFCSERCRQIDLLRWSKGQYAIVEPLTPERMAEQELDDESDQEQS
ncbi:MAG: DNA gyrase inhibitor YacG [Planctomycetaceae bacterium]|nr:DNA gyrase inhibitor YacG [Planctomycetaceae bacterium]